MHKSNSKFDSIKGDLLTYAYLHLILFNLNFVDASDRPIRQYSICVMMMTDGHSIHNMNTNEITCTLFHFISITERTGTRYCLMLTQCDHLSIIYLIIYSQ